jgi:prepilin-type N-terminal cleavage/methylation domain-containing protein
MVFLKPGGTKEMRVTRLNQIVSSQRGFTLVELLMVVGILAVLASIGAKALTVNREKSYDAQVISIMRSLLTVSAIEEPAPLPPESPDSDVLVTYDGQGGSLGFLGTQFSSLEVAQNIYWKVVNDGNSNDDKWQFFFAHPAGNNGYYFWIPGSACNVDDDVGDGTGNPSDKIYWDDADGSYRKTASDDNLA